MMNITLVHFLLLFHRDFADNFVDFELLFGSSDGGVQGAVWVHIRGDLEMWQVLHRNLSAKHPLIQIILTIILRRMNLGQREPTCNHVMRR